MPRVDFLAFAFGVLICAIGVASLVGHVLRPRPKDRLLLWVGLFALLYGARMLVNIDAIGALLFTGDEGSAVDAAISFTIVLPAIMFTEEIYGPGWHDSLRWLAIAVAAYAIAGLAVGVASGRPHRVPDPALTLFAPGLAFVFVAGYASGYRPKPFPEWRLLAGAFVVFIGFVLNEHATAARLTPWTVRLEPIGMLFFNGCLALIAVSRLFANQRQLIAVEKEMDAARQIQASILPRELPAVAGVDIAVRYEPLAAVAGDFYDVIAAGDGAIVALVADVSGHGVPAALIASMVKVAFAAEAARTADPAAILAGMNATLCGMFDRAYVTAVCAKIATRSIAYATAGHPPPILLSGDRATVLDERGMFIGMFPSAIYATTTVAIDGGTRLILYTDGVTEAADPSTDDLFGLDRLIETARAGRTRPARECADHVVGAVAAFARRDPPPHDDLTVMVVDVRMPAG